MSRFGRVVSHRVLALDVAIGALLLVGCARVDTDTEGAPAPVAVPEVSAPAIVRDPATLAPVLRAPKKVPDATAGHLEHPARLASLFSRLHALEEHEADSDVRIVQFGDSHTSSDYGTSVARARLAGRFGDGGRGFIPMGAPYKRLFQAGEGMARGTSFDPEEGSLYAKGVRPDGFYGPTGIAMDAKRAGASMTSELSASADRFEIAYLTQPNGGSFDIYLDGQRTGRVATHGESRASGFHPLEVTRGPHTLEVRAVGDGAVRVFGVRLDDSAAGVTFDALGVNAAKATTQLSSDETHFGEQLAHIAPALAIIAYGTNESGDSTTTPDDHVAALRSLVERVKKGAPGVECLVLGPPDRDAKTYTGARTLPKLVDILAAQRQAADEAGCAFYDQFMVMGGQGAIGRWANESPPRARRDFVHLTRAGYAFLAEALVQDLLTAYASWKGDSALAEGTR